MSAPILSAPLSAPAAFTPLAALLDAHTPFNDLEAAYMTQLRQFLADSSNPFDRSNHVAHCVADCWVVSPDRQQVLLLVHGANKVWMSPGGHADGSPDIFDAALRELGEEAGLLPHQVTPLLGGRIFDINTGAVPDRTNRHGFEPAHLHFDVCFAFEADPTTLLTISDESLDLAWKPTREALEMIYPCHRRRVEKTLAGVILPDL